MSSSQYDWAKNIPCRNVQIHGFCKFEHKGCSYNHELAKENEQKKDSSPISPTISSTTTNAALGKSVSPSALLASLNNNNNNNNNSANSSLIDPNNASKAPIFKPTLLKQQTSINSINSNFGSSTPDNKKFKIDSPAFTPISLSKFSTLSPSVDQIPTFIPSTISNNSTEQPQLQPQQSQQPQQPQLGYQINSNLPSTNIPATTISSTLNNLSTPLPNTLNETSSGLNDFNALRTSLPTTKSFNPMTAPIFTPKPSSNDILPNNFSNNIQPPTGEELFYQNTNLYPVNFLLYAPPPPPHVNLNKKQNERTVDDLFINNQLRQYLQLKNEESLKSISNNELDLPLHVGTYHSLYPIDHNYDYNTKSFGYTSIVYKCMSNDDGKLYTMRRLKNVPITTPSVLKSFKQWKKVDCANCVKIYDVFTTRAFNDNSLILIYDYYPMSMTLLENHFMSFPGKNPELITEDILWNYTIQLLNAITEINKLGLNIGKLDSSKIIITNKGRIRLSALAIKDILRDVKKKNASNDPSSLGIVDDESDLNSNSNDLLNLGELILFLAKSTTFMQNPTEDPYEIISQLKFTNVFKKMLIYLFSKDATIEKFQELVAPMILKLTNGLQNSCDTFESTLMSELENARLVRLISKLDFISERPEMVKDGSWSETGERYPIKLFKDYVFHQVDENGKPVVDLTHVINCLNKLDAGVDENLLLVSPDEMTCLIMSYKDLKDLINRSFLSLIGKN